MVEKNYTNSYLLLKLPFELFFNPLERNFGLKKGYWFDSLQILLLCKEFQPRAEASHH